MAANATNVQAYYGGWRTITSIQAYDTTWRTIQEVWVKDGGTWRPSWINSDPQTYYYYPSWDQTYRSSGAQRSTSYLYQGYYSSTYGEHKSLMGFDYADIQSKLAIRPVVTKVELRMSSEHFYLGDYNNPIGWTRHGGHNYTTKPTTWTGTEVFDYNGAAGHEQTWTGGYAGARDQTITFELPTGVGDLFRDGTIYGLTLYAHEPSNQYYYCYFWGTSASESLKPRLAITCDYS